MTPITHLRQAESLAHLDHTLALELVQALHRHLAPSALMEVLWHQVVRLTPASGMRYRHEPLQLDIGIGDGPHSASYTLSHHGESLGELELRFRQAPDEAVLRAAEDLLALAIPALRNALTHQSVCRQAARLERALQNARRGGDSAGAAVVPLHAARTAPAAPTDEAAPSSPWEDALVLVSLDGYEDIRAAHGDVWAQTLIQTIQNQIDEGLRDADSVFQIDEGLLAVLLPRTSEDAAIDVAGKIRVLISGLHLRDGRITTQLTACMGVVGARAAHTPEDVLFQARAALAQAQQEGANTIRAYRR
ncbi:MAG TPA: diguanylate cyclase [Pseudomonadales bacterium]